MPSRSNGTFQRAILALLFDGSVLNTVEIRQRAYDLPLDGPFDARRHNNTRRCLYLLERQDRIRYIGWSPRGNLWALPWRAVQHRQTYLEDMLRRTRPGGRRTRVVLIREMKILRGLRYQGYTDDEIAAARLRLGQRADVAVERRMLEPAPLAAAA